MRHMGRRSALWSVLAIFFAMVLAGFTDLAHAPTIMDCGKNVAYDEAFVEGLAMGDIGRLCVGATGEMVRSAEALETEAHEVLKKRPNPGAAKSVEDGKVESDEASTVEDETAETDFAEDETSDGGQAVEESGGPNEYWFEVGGRGDGQDLLDAGYLTEWESEYYCAHNYTSHGEMIAALQVGDLVHVDGGTVRICGCLDFSKDGYYEDIREILPDEVCFQTCYPDGSNLVMIKYGYWQ